MKIMIAIPCMETVHTQFMERLLALEKPDGTMVITARSSLVYDARNVLSHMAIKDGYDRILWLDSDMLFGPDLLMRLSDSMDSGRRYVSGMYFTRKNPLHPVVYKETGLRKEENGSFTPYCTPVSQDMFKNAMLCGFVYTDTVAHNIQEPRNNSCDPDDYLIEVAATGMGACLMEVSVIEEVFNNFGLPFTPEPGFGEDLSFCRRCAKLGIQMWCDTSLQLGHIAQKVVGIEEYKHGFTL